MMRQTPLNVEEAIRRLPGKDCGLCGRKTCFEFAQTLRDSPEQIERCVFIAHSDTPQVSATINEITYRDILDREYDFVLEKMPTDLGPRETILLFNPANLERLGVKKGDVLVGRPAAAGCPVSHCGIVVSEPDFFNGMVEWQVIGPMAARERGVDIGMYTPIAYEGLALFPRQKLQFGMRYFFLPRYCMLQVRHSGLVNMLAQRQEGLFVRMEGIMLA
ncbi:MAG: Fe-S cluster protein [Nitrospinota bacterium]|nr:Fe-S cluster protein [Nitrospinota bacterium]